MKKVKLYTDGACSGNPGKGGWAAILLYGKHSKQTAGYEENTTNNKMELTAVIEGLKCLKEPCEVEVFSDSSYVINAFQKGWVDSWCNNGWIKADKKAVKNKQLWEQLVELNKIHKVEWIKVKGHTDDEFNNLCDSLARKQIDNSDPQDNVPQDVVIS